MTPDMNDAPIIRADQGVYVGAQIFLGVRKPWYVNAWRWIRRKVLRHKNVPGGPYTITAYTGTTITTDRPIDL